MCFRQMKRCKNDSAGNTAHYTAGRLEADLGLDCSRESLEQDCSRTTHCVVAFGGVTADGGRHIADVGLLAIQPDLEHAFVVAQSVNTLHSCCLASSESLGESGLQIKPMSFESDRLKTELLATHPSVSSGSSSSPVAPGGNSSLSSRPFHAPSLPNDCPEDHQLLDLGEKTWRVFCCYSRVRQKQESSRFPSGVDLA